MQEFDAEKSNFDEADEEIEFFYKKLKSERDFNEAIDILNHLLGGGAATQIFRMVNENEVVLVHIANDEVIRKMQKDEICSFYPAAENDEARKKCLVLYKSQDFNDAGDAARAELNKMYEPSKEAIAEFEQAGAQFKIRLESKSARS